MPLSPLPEALPEKVMERLTKEERRATRGSTVSTRRAARSRSSVGVAVAEELSRIIATLPSGARVGGKFDGDVRQLIFGKPTASVLPLTAFMCVDNRQIVRAATADDDRAQIRAR